MSEIQPPPRTVAGILRQLGPGLIISANIVGSGELIVTTKLGADVGFTLLWFIIAGCMIKVLLQVELGRYTVSTGRTTLDAMNSLPGPRFVVSWLVWFWLLMFVATFFQLSGIVGAIAGVFQLGGSNLGNTAWAVIVTGSCAVLLFIGRYGFVERFSTFMVAAFTLFTVFAVFSLYWTEYGITGAQIAEGLSFRLPDDFVVAFAAFGVIGVGASELIYYPYWCLEKGYARHVGPNDGTPEWTARAKGWVRVLQWDAWVSMVIYTGATIAFYMLGAAVLHGKGLEVSDSGLIRTLSNLYSESFGTFGLWVFLFGAFMVLYSTVFISTASNGRLAVDILRLFGLFRSDDPAARRRRIRIACVALPGLYLVFYLTVGSPLMLVLVGATAQALMLPFLCFAGLYFLHRGTDPALRPSGFWTSLLWISAALMTAVGVYQILERFDLL